VKTQYYTAASLDGFIATEDHSLEWLFLGAGKPLLPRAITSPPLVLRGVRAVGTGFAELHYEVPRT
jgi:hypothetical protein